MAVSLKYGQLDIPGVPDDEPVFVLRAQDAAAVNTALGYRREAAQHGAGAELLGSVDRAVGSMTTWQFRNPGRVKVPD